MSLSVVWRQVCSCRKGIFQCKIRTSESTKYFGLLITTSDEYCKYVENMSHILQVVLGGGQVQFITILEVVKYMIHILKER